MPWSQMISSKAQVVPLQKGEIFGVVAAPDASLKEQAEQAGKHLTVGIPTHHMHSMGNATGDVIVGDAAHGVSTGVSAAEAAARADKVARIRASFTAEFPEALFVAPEEPAAPVSAETGGDVEMQEEVEDEAAARFRAEDALQALRAAVQVWMEISCAGLYT